MIKLILKSIIRSLRRNLVVSAIQFTGFTLGLTGAVIIFLYVSEEFSYDKFHKSSEKIYRLNTILHDSDQKIPLALAAGPMGPQIKKDFPEIVDHIRMGRTFSKTIVEIHNQQFYETDILYAENSFFKYFDFPLIAGNKNKALVKQNQVIITRQTAEKLFLNKNPLGERIKINDQSYEISAVLENLPANTQFQFDYLISFETLVQQQEPVNKSWTWTSFPTFIVLKDKVSHDAVNKKIRNYADKFIENAGDFRVEMALEPLAQTHFNTSSLGNLKEAKDAAILRLLSAIGILLIALASSNYIGIQIARNFLKYREITLRKIFGANKLNIASYFILESILFVLGSFVLSLLLFEILQLPIHWLTGLDLNLFSLIRFDNLVLIFSLLLFTSIVSGLIPFLQLKPIPLSYALKNKVYATKSGSKLRIMLIIFQFAITITLFMNIIIIGRQMNYLYQTKPGFQMDKIMVLDFGGNKEVIEKIKLVRNEFLKNSQIEGLTFSSHVPGEMPHTVTATFKSNGEEKQIESDMIATDHDFFKNYDLQVTDGRQFSPSYSRDTTGLLMNEFLAKQLSNQTKEVLNKDIRQWEFQGKVIGIVKNFHHLSLHNPYKALTFQMRPDLFEKISIRISPNANYAKVNQWLSDKWEELFPKIPYNSVELRSQWLGAYKSDANFGKTLALFTLIAISIAALGCLSMIYFIASTKQKEVCVRKILGASPKTIQLELYKLFVLPLTISILIAIPCSFLTSDYWLSSFAYKITPEMIDILLAIVGIAVIVFLTISFQIRKLSYRNPAAVLKED